MTHQYFETLTKCKNCKHEIVDEDRPAYFLEAMRQRQAEGKEVYEPKPRWKHFLHGKRRIQCFDCKCINAEPKKKRGM